MYFQNGDLSSPKYSFKYLEIFRIVWFCFRNVQNGRKLSISVKSQKLQLMIVEYHKAKYGDLPKLY